MQDVLFSVPESNSKDKIQKKIDALRRKKINIIDLAAEGLISKEDMREQNAMYTKELEELSLQLVEDEKRAATNLDRAKRIEFYISRIQELTHVEPDNEEALHNLLKKAVVYRDKFVDLYLNFTSFYFRMWYQTSGRSDNFTVNVLGYKIIDIDTQF